MSLTSRLGRIARSAISDTTPLRESPAYRLLFAGVAVQAAFAAVDGPARRAIVPALVRAEKLPAANTLSYGTMTLAVILGPLIAGLAIGAGGYEWAYGIDAVSFVALLYAAVRLPRLPAAAEAPRAGLASVLEGLRFVRGKRLIMATFLADLNAMVFGMPKALYP